MKVKPCEGGLYVHRGDDNWERLVGRDLYRWAMDELGLSRYLPITLKEAADRFHIPYSTLAQAAREGRIEVTRQFGVWLTSEVAIEEAMERGSIRRRK